MKQGTFIFVFTALLVALASAAMTAHARPVQFVFTSTIESTGDPDSSPIPGVSVGDTMTVTLLADNGVDSLASQEWLVGDLISAYVTAGSYWQLHEGGGFNGPDDIIFATDPAGNLMSVGFVGTDYSGTHTDPNESGGSILLPNDGIWDYDGNVVRQADLLNTFDQWTLSQAQPIPDPVLEFLGTEDYIDAYGNDYTRYDLSISNWQLYPEELFVQSYAYPCGDNPYASRTLVYIYDQDDNGLYGFCGLESPYEMTGIWFGLPQGTLPPSGVYVRMTDQHTGAVYFSNVLPIPPEPEPQPSGYPPTSLPLDPEGSGGMFQLYEFDDNNFNFGVKYNADPQLGDDIYLVVQPILISQDDLDAIVAGSDFEGAYLVPYDGTGGKGVLFRVTCEDADHIPVECPVPVDEYEAKTAWWPPSGDQTIVAPAYLKAPIGTNLWVDILSSYYEDRFDGMAIGRSCCHYSDFVFVDMGEGSDMGTLLPTITITTPANGAVYTLNQYFPAEYSCSAGALCSGTVDTGSPIDTSSLGVKAFDVMATVDSDHGPVSYIKSVSYNVEESTYLFHLLYDPNRKVRSGAAYPIKLQVHDIDGKNISASSLVLTAVNVAKVTNGFDPAPNYTGNANPENNFRFDPALGGGGYIYNLSTEGLETGTYVITFVVNGGQQLYQAQFKVR
jgi:hypothetical protein